MSVWLLEPVPPPATVAARWSKSLADAVDAYNATPNNSDVKHAMLSAFEPGETDEPGETEAFQGQLAARRERIAVLLADLNGEFSKLSQDLGLLEWCQNPNGRYLPKTLEVNFGRRPLNSAKAGTLLACLGEIGQSSTGSFSVVNHGPRGLMPVGKAAMLKQAVGDMAYETGVEGSESHDPRIVGGAA